MSYVTQWADWWLAHGYDPATGRFWARLDRSGSPKDQRETSLAQSRNAYALTRAFMLTGKRSYLEAAKLALTYMDGKFWDPVAGGWLRYTYGKDNPKTGAKAADVMPENVRTAFHQHYCLLGTGAYLEAARDPVVQAIHDRGRQSNETRLWDATPGQQGYFQNWYADGSAPTGKGFAATADGITTHHLADWLTIGDPLSQTRLRDLGSQISSHYIASMDDPITTFGFVTDYGSDWSIDRAATKHAVDIGHVLKAGWVSARSFMALRDPAFRTTARRMLDEVWNYDASGPNSAWDHVNGGPYAMMDYVTGLRTSANKSWWGVEQGFTGGIAAWHITGDATYLRMADESLAFFYDHFVDTQYGEVFESVSADGLTPIATDKATDWKAGYHSTELAYLAYLYGSLYLHGQDVALHYDLAPGAERTITLNPVEILAESGLCIRSVTLDGQPYADFAATARSLHLPAGVGGVFRVVYGVQRAAEALHRPIIAGLPASSIGTVGKVQTVALRLAAVDVPVESLVVTASSSNTALVPTTSIRITGAGADRSIAITPRQGVSGTAVVTITVSGGGASTVATIQVQVDLPAAGLISCVQAGVTAPESASGVAIRLQRTGGSTGTVSARLTPRLGDATAGQDYASAYQTVTWGDGDTTERTVTIPLVNDAQAEDSEVFRAILGSLTGGAALGVTSQTYVTILDDDAPALPAPWLHADLGSVLAAGSARPLGDDVLVTGSGSGLAGTADGGQFLYQAATGDVSLIVHVTAQASTASGARAGLMVRSSLDAGAANACVAITPGLGVVFQSRSPLRATTSVTRIAGVTAPVWLRLTCIGGRATGAYGPDGQTWTDIGTRQLALGSDVLAGAAVTSASNGTLSTATLHDLQLMPIGAN